MALRPKTDEEIQMNQRTVKLLKKYALQKGQPSKQVKRWWNALPWTQRAGERRRLLRETKLYDEKKAQ